MVGDGRLAQEEVIGGIRRFLHASYNNYAAHTNHGVVLYDCTGQMFVVVYIYILHIMGKTTTHHS